MRGLCWGIRDPLPKPPWEPIFGQLNFVILNSSSRGGGTGGGRRIFTPGEYSSCADIKPQSEAVLELGTRRVPACQNFSGAAQKSSSGVVGILIFPCLCQNILRVLRCPGFWTPSSPALRQLLEGDPHPALQKVRQHAVNAPGALLEEKFLRLTEKFPTGWGREESSPWPCKRLRTPARAKAQATLAAVENGGKWAKCWVK